MDLRLSYSPTLLMADLSLAGPDLAGDDGLETAVVLSLLTDRRARADDRLPGAPDDKRGWWGDAFATVRGDEIGSRLWLLNRSKEQQAVLLEAKALAEEALSWLVEDGLARSVEVIPSVPRREVLGLEVRISRPDGTATTLRFARFWAADSGAIAPPTPPPAHGGVGIGWWRIGWDFVVS
jgi:phage gp46-like protein